MDWLTDPQAWIALASLTALEIVLGVDNVVFISILANKLPPEQRDRARSLGLMLALLGRVALLLGISWVIGLTANLFVAFGHGISGRDLVLLIGGLFLIGKATHEIHGKLEGGDEHTDVGSGATFGSVIVQILLLDIVFSLDSVITAVGMVDQVEIRIAAVVIALLFMMVTAKAVAAFIERHPTVKMLALSFLLLVGVALMAESFDAHLPRGYIYSAMGFSIFVEMLNLRMRRNAKAVRLYDTGPS